MPALVWHSHEMVFGFLPALFAGYLLTTTPNWSGHLPASGRPLAALFSLWVAGRILPLVLPFILGSIVDIAFPVTVAACLAREGRARSAQQTRHGLMLFPLLAVLSGLHRVASGDPEWAAMTARGGVAVAVLMIAAVGGRLVPSFTRNLLTGRGEERVPEPYGRFDVAVLILTLIGLLPWVLSPMSLPACLFAAICCFAHAARLLRWRGWLLRQVPVVFLHVGYLWVVVGFGLAALAAEPLLLVPPDAALHAFSAGAIGGMAIVVMVQLSLTRGAGHRPASRLCLIAILLIDSGAVLRVAAPVDGARYLEWLVAGAALWSLGFALFALAHAPITSAIRSSSAPTRASGSD